MGAGSPWAATGSLTPVGGVDGCAPAWSATATYTSGDVVSRAGVNHTAMWWSRGDVPGANTTNAWDAGLPCA